MANLLTLKVGEPARVTKIRAENHIDQRILSLYTAFLALDPWHGWDEAFKSEATRTTVSPIA